MRRSVRCAVVWAVLLAPVSLWAQATAPARVPIGQYIAETWSTLTRTHRELARAAVDPKFPAPVDGRWPVYPPASADLANTAKLLQGEMDPGEFNKNKIDLRRLPAAGVPTPQQG